MDIRPYVVDSNVRIFRHHPQKEVLVIKKIRILIFIAVCSALLPACAHFSSSSFQEEYVQGDQTTFNTGDSVFLKINSYANWSDYSTVNTLVADALQESFSKKGIKAKFLSE
ncbi:hypothetical protein, partial [Oleiphilus sp. HI0061]|uniref:hypothetical protein n=1 Tax=Oleiphilus sp. HI0061 TaxID=1822239 RepID=UPI000B1337A7